MNDGINHSINVILCSLRFLKTFSHFTRDILKKFFQFMIQIIRLWSVDLRVNRWIRERKPVYFAVPNMMRSVTRLIRESTEGCRLSQRLLFSMYYFPLETDISVALHSNKPKLNAQDRLNLTWWFQRKGWKCDKFTDRQRTFDHQKSQILHITHYFITE